jgi:hypothetical protein
MKICTNCNKQKSLTDFGKHRLHNDGLASHCRECANAKKRTPEYRIQQRKSAKEWRAVNPDKVKKYRKNFYQSEHGQRAVVNWNLKKSYGITFEQYNEKFKEQDGKCAICKTHQSLLTKRLAVDHDHKTGEIRSLLCHGCNTSLGGFCDDINILESAINYLKIYQNKGAII